MSIWSRRWEPPALDYWDNEWEYRWPYYPYFYGPACQPHGRIGFNQYGYAGCTPIIILLVAPGRWPYCRPEITMPVPNPKQHWPNE